MISHGDTAKLFFNRVEKNATGWSRSRLSELLLKQTLESEKLTVQLGAEFKKLEGDATANNRKAKLIFLFDWVIELGFTARIVNSEFEYKGVLDIPNLSDENEANEVDVSKI